MDGAVELRLVGLSTDGQRLVLTDSAGIERTVAIDERLRAAVNGHRAHLGQLTMASENHISPKEIQTRVRAGESADHVAETAGVPLERVLRFVGPVLQEREHVADQARQARLVKAGPDAAPGPTTLLGDLVDRVCARRDVSPDEVIWDSARRDDHSWAITVTWPDGAVASWSFDLLRHQVTPLDAASRRISGAPAESATEPAAGHDPDELLDELDAPASAANVRQFTRRPLPPPPTKAAHELTFDDLAESLDADEDTHNADVDADTGDGEDAAPRSGQSSAGSDPSNADSTSRNPSSVAPASRGSQRSSKRAVVPNWDDIVFGMKPKE